MGTTQTKVNDLSAREQQLALMNGFCRRNHLNVTLPTVIVSLISSYFSIFPFDIYDKTIIDCVWDIQNNEQIVNIKNLKTRKCKPISLYSKFHFH